MNLRAISFGAVLLLPCFWSARAATVYVDVNSANPTPPYSDITTAAVTIQDAVDAAASGDLILVNDGYYQDGFRVTKGSGFPANNETNRVGVSKPVTIQSINGPAAAYISGSGIYRCVYLTNGAALSGFTLTSGAAGYVTTGFGGTHTTVAADGGAVTGTLGGSGVVSNCVLSGNSATASGGGAYEVELINCTLTSNSAKNGGGAGAATLLNCIVTGNTAIPVTAGGPFPTTSGGDGGGIYAGSAVNCVVANNNGYQGGGTWGVVKLNSCIIANNSATSYGGVSPNTSSSIAFSAVTNCIIYFNSANTYYNYSGLPYGNLFISGSCTLPLPSSGRSNITNPPTFVSFGSDYHPAPDSPVINAGNNAWVTNSTDLDGNPRIVGGTVDMGAYEYQTPTSVLSFAWLENYGLPTDGTADFVDTDGDGMNNWQEWIAGTDPTNAASLLTMMKAAVGTNFIGVKVTWQSVNTRTYYLQRSPNLFASPAFTGITSNLLGAAGATTFTDTTATNGGPYFYRVGVQ